SGLVYELVGQTKPPLEVRICGAHMKPEQPVVRSVVEDGVSRCSLLKIGRDVMKAGHLRNANARRGPETGAEARREDRGLPCRSDPGHTLRCPRHSHRRCNGER